VAPLPFPPGVYTQVSSTFADPAALAAFQRALANSRTFVARRAAEVSYREGAVSLLEFLEAERAFIQTQREHLDALLDGHTAAFDVTRAAALEAAP